MDGLAYLNRNCNGGGGSDASDGMWPEGKVVFCQPQK
jgi:hypothetical protein